MPTIGKLTEAEFLAQVLDLAGLCGWLRAHFRPALTRRGRWVTAVQADGAGFPDLVLVRERVIFAELKTDRGKLRPEQERWLARLLASGQECYVWRPGDWERIAARLRR